MESVSTDTIDVQLSTCEVRGLSEPVPQAVAAEKQTGQVEPPTAASAEPTRRRGGRNRIIAASATLAVLGVAAYWAWSSGPSDAEAALNAGAAASTTEVASLPAQPALVRFTNPFDTDEVFEFPAGTSEAQARDAVAEILLNRAMERRNPSPVTASTN